MKIRNCKIKNNTSGSYERLIGNKKYSELITKIQSCVISQGTELEKSIKKYIKNQNPNCFIENLKDFINLLGNNRKEQYFYFLDINVYKEFLKNSGVKKIKNPDFVIIMIKKNTINVIEIKEGYSFDTKKSLGEKTSLEKIQKDLSSVIENYSVYYYFCSFYADNIDKIFKGLKQVINKEFLLTGKMFFEMIKLDYKKYCLLREKELKDDQEDNYNYIYEIITKNKKNL